MPYRRHNPKYQMQRNPRLIYLCWYPSYGPWIAAVDGEAKRRLRKCFRDLDLRSHNGFLLRPRVRFEERFSFPRKAWRKARWRIRYVPLPTVRQFRQLTGLNDPSISRDKPDLRRSKASLSDYFPGER